MHNIKEASSEASFLMCRLRLDFGLSGNREDVLPVTGLDYSIEATSF